MCVCMHVCVCVYMYVCMYLCVCMFVFSCMFVCTCASMHLCIFACVHVLMYAYVHVCIFACMHVCICSVLHTADVPACAWIILMENTHMYHFIALHTSTVVESLHQCSVQPIDITWREVDSRTQSIQGSRKQHNLGFLDWKTSSQHTPTGGRKVPSSENRSTVSWSTCSGAGEGVVGARAATRQGVDAPCWSHRCVYQKRKVNKYV